MTFSRCSPGRESAGLLKGADAFMIIKYLLLLIRYIKEGFSFFFSLPLRFVLFGLGLSAAIFLFLIWQKARRKEEMKVRTLIPLAVLLLYLVLVVIITTIARTPRPARRYDFRFLHTVIEAMHGSGYAVKLIFFNQVLLSPIGFLVPLILEHRCSFRDILFLSFLVSAFIECTQYIFLLGLMEGDDLIHNCLGALAGYGLALLMKKAFVYRMKKRKK